MPLPLLAASTFDSLPALAVALLLAGTATAPTMVTAMTLLQQRAPEDRLNESMSLAVTGLLTGIACGSATAGWTADHTSPTTAFWLPVAAATTALLAGARNPTP